MRESILGRLWTSAFSDEAGVAAWDYALSEMFSRDIAADQEAADSRVRTKCETTRWLDKLAVTITAADTSRIQIPLPDVTRVECISETWDGVPQWYLDVDFEIRDNAVVFRRAPYAGVSGEFREKTLVLRGVKFSRNHYGKFWGGIIGLPRVGSARDRDAANAAIDCAVNAASVENISHVVSAAVNAPTGSVVEKLDEDANTVWAVSSSGVFTIPAEVFDETLTGNVSLSGTYFGTLTELQSAGADIHVPPGPISAAGPILFRYANKDIQESDRGVPYPHGDAAEGVLAAWGNTLTGNVFGLPAAGSASAVTQFAKLWPKQYFLVCGADFPTRPEWFYVLKQIWPANSSIIINTVQQYEDIGNDAAAADFTLSETTQYEQTPPAATASPTAEFDMRG